MLCGDFRPQIVMGYTVYYYARGGNNTNKASYFNIEPVNCTVDCRLGENLERIYKLRAVVGAREYYYVCDGNLN